jgi:cytochrome c-type biogenesis protein CcmH
MMETASVTEVRLHAEHPLQNTAESPSPRRKPGSSSLNFLDSGVRRNDDRVDKSFLGRCIAFLFCILFVSVVNPALAKEAAPLAQDEAVEKRMVAISSELRCLVCQNESLSASNAELAHDLRREIRSQITAGKSDGEIREFMVSRYGDFVLYRPPLKGTTLLLWFGPALFFAVGLVALIRYLRRRNLAIKDAPLSADEQAELDRLLSAKDPKD